MSIASRSIVYVSCSKGDCIEVLALDQTTGALSQIETVALSGNGMPLAIAPNKQHLYAALSANVGGKAEPRYATFSIAPLTGRLEHIATIDAPGRMSHITVERSGRHLLGASVANDLISSTVIQPDSTLNPEPTQVHTVPSKAHQITTDLSNKFAYVPNLGADLVMQLTFDAETGTFADNAPPKIDQAEGAAPRHIAHHPNGRFAYLLNEEDGTITALQLDPSNGTLEPLQTSNFLPPGFDDKPWGAQILITANGRFLYASERTSSTIAIHAIDPETGMMTKSTSWPTELCPRNFAIHPSGQWLISAGEKSNRVASYAIDQTTGLLSQKSTLNTGDGPLWVEVLELD